MCEFDSHQLHQLFKENNYKDLAKKIDHYFENRDELDALSKEYLSSSKKFSQDYCMEQMEKMLEETIANYKKIIKEKIVFMEVKETLIENISKVHTTPMGVDRIRRNIDFYQGDVVEYLIKKTLDSKANIYKNGKNYYVEIDGIIITINSYSYTIITAHKM